MKMVHILLGSIVAAAAVGGVRTFAGSPPAPAPREAPPIAAEAADPGAAEEAPPSASIAGEVLERIDVPSYTYLRVGPKGSQGTWTAVPTTKVAVGASVRVLDPMKMEGFKSTALDRTFPVIYFGTLEGEGAEHGAMGGAEHGAMGGAEHGAMGGADPHAMGSADPHAGFAKPPVEVKAVPRAEGPNGRTVAEIHGQRDALRGKTVRIRGTVVKVTAGVLGKTYLHLRDGTGDEKAGTNDLTVTTQATPSPGATVVVEGVVAIDRDVGAGYTFPTLVEEAKVVAQ